MYYEFSYASSQGNCRLDDGTLVYYYNDDWGSMPGSASFDIEYNATTATWAWYGPGHALSWPNAGQLINSGAGVAQLETYGSGQPNVSSFDFGTSGGYLKLKTGSGWKSWTPYTTTFRWNSATFDERYNSNPCITRSDYPYQGYYHFLAYAKASGC